MAQKTFADKAYVDAEVAKKADKSHGTHLTLGTGSGNAYRGDYGNTAYNHSQAAHAPSNAQKNSDITKAEIEAKLIGTITTHKHTLLESNDTRSKNELPSTYTDRGIVPEFKSSTTIGLPNVGKGFTGLITYQQWSDVSAWSGGKATQFGTIDDGRMYYRKGDGSGWGSWYQFYTTQNKPTPADIGAAVSNHGNHVPATQAAQNTTFLRNDNTWYKLTLADLGAAASSHGTHVTYGTTAPLVAGTASAGSANTVSRSDHVHPAQTSITGNAATATKATQDSAGQQINTTYIKGLSVSGKTITYTKGDGTTGTITTQDTNTTYNAATQSAAGLMSADDKKKLDGIATSANNYSHPTATAYSSGLYKVTVNNLGHVTSATAVVKADITALGIPGSDTNTWRGVQDNLTSTATDQSLSANQGRVLQNNKADKTLLGEDLSNKTISLNDLNLSSGDPKFKVYYCPTDGNGSNITGRPNDSSKQAFNLIIESLRWASTTDYITKQTYTQGSQKIIYVRYCTNGTWSAWEKVYTSGQKPTTSDIGAAPTSHASTATTYGSSSASNYGHAMASSTTPKANGTAAVGSETAKFARGDHVHPLQTTVSGSSGSCTGNAATATKFASSQSVALTGDVTGSASSQAGWSVATTLANSGVTAGNYGPSANASPAHSGTFSVPYITVDAKGRITAASTKTITLPADNNTDTKVTNTVNTTTKYYVTGSSSASTNTGTQIFDTNVYVDATAGKFVATTMAVNNKVQMQYNSTSESLDFIFI